MAAYKDEQRGTWYVSFHYYDWTGKNCRKVKRGFKTKREATEWERHFRMKEAADLDMTFEEFVQAYTRDMKPKLKHNTWLTKEHILRTKLLPYFKDKKMRDIRPKDIIQWQNEQISYRDEKGKPYAPTYLKTLQSELSALFNHAVRFYELKSNPVVKAGPLGKGKAEEMLFWTKEEYLKFIEAVKDKPYSYHAFQILYWCGLRVGELLALTSQDIDFDNKVIRITKSYQRLEGKDVITDPKTPKSKRNVSMPDFLSSIMPRPARPMWPTGKPVTPKNFWPNMRQTSCSIRQPKMPLKIWGSRSCPRSRSCKPSTPSSWRKRKRPMPSTGALVRR